MMMRNYFLIWCCFLWPGLFAGAQDTIYSFPEPRQSVEFFGTGYLNSNTITNEMIRKFYYGDYISETVKQNASDAMLQMNHLGGMSKVGLTYTYDPDIPGKALFSFSVFDRKNLDVKFRDDLFYLLFYGNKMFSGQEAVVGPFVFRYFSYQQFRLGWDWKGDDFHGSYGMAFSLLSGNNYFSLKLPASTLYTASDGSFLDLNIQMQLDRSDTTNRKYFSQNGSGISTDLYYEMPYTFWNKPGRFRVDLKDLGMIRWNSNSLQYSCDSSFHYEGITVDDLFHLDSTFTDFSVSQVFDRNTNQTRNQFTTWIPGTLDLRTKSNYGKQIVFEKGIIWRFNTTARMYYYARLHFLLGRRQKTDLAYLIGYGGYGRFNSGFDLSTDLFRTCTIGVASNYLFSGVQARSGNGMGLFVRLVKRF